MLDHSITKLKWMIDRLHHEDVFFMSETWNDFGSFALDCLRASAFTIIDCPRPHDPNDALSEKYRAIHPGFSA